MYAIRSYYGAAGTTGTVQFNDGTGLFAADADFTWSTTTNTLTVNGTLTTNIIVATGATSTFSALDITTGSTTVFMAGSFFQDGLPDCDSEGETLLYNGSTGIFFCGTDVV